MSKKIEKYLESNHLSYYSALRNDLGDLGCVGDLINNYTKHLTEQLAEKEKELDSESQDKLFNDLIDVLMSSRSLNPKQDIELLKSKFTIKRNNN